MIDAEGKIFQSGVRLGLAAASYGCPMCEACRWLIARDVEYLECKICGHQLALRDLIDEAALADAAVMPTE